MTRELLTRGFGLALLAFAGWLLYRTAGSMFSDWEWRYALWIVASLVLALIGFGRLFPGQPPPLAIETGDPIMAAAMARAQRELDRFRKGVAEGRKNALVKYAMKTGYGENEHVWAIAHAFDGDEVVTSLASEPVGVAEQTPGRRRIAAGDIEDWLLIDDDETMEGGFTQVAMARIYKRDKGYVPYAIRKGLGQFKDLDDADLL